MLRILKARLFWTNMGQICKALLAPKCLPWVRLTCYLGMPLSEPFPLQILLQAHFFQIIDSKTTAINKHSTQ